MAAAAFVSLLALVFVRNTAKKRPLSIEERSGNALIPNRIIAHELKFRSSLLLNYIL